MTQNGELQAGDRVAGRYVILEEIGRGGFGVVYRAVQEGVNRHVALKTVRHSVHDIQGFNLIEAFRQEALHTSRLRHPNTITLFDYGETEDGTLFLVTEFLEGETLYERMWRQRTFSDASTIHIGKQISKSLGEAHETGIIHGDLKPANIFLCHVSGEEDFVKVLDFGIAKIIGEVDPAGLGTPEYMSPEQFAGQPLLAASDIYSLGIILYEMLAGHRPFEDKSTQRLAQRHQREPLPALPPELENSPVGRVVRRATAKDPAARYRNGHELYRALKAIEGSPQSLNEVPARPAPPVPAPEPIPSHSVLPAPGSAPRSAPRSVPGSQSSLQAPHSRNSSRFRRRPSGLIRSHRFEESAQPLALIGRVWEKDWFLDQAHDIVESQEGKVVLLGGESGSGKTRLMAWLQTEADLPQNLRCGSGSYREGSPVVLEGFVDALASALGRPRRLAIGHDHLQLEATFSVVLKRKLTPGEHGALHNLVAPSPQIGRSPQRIAAIADLVLKLAEARPLLLNLDNLRWAQEPTFLLLHSIAQKLEKSCASLMIVAAIRREALPTMARTADLLKKLAARDKTTESFALLGLLPEESAELCRVAFRTEYNEETRLSDALIKTIVGRSHGNPLYIRHLLRCLKEQDLLSSSPEGYQLRPSVRADRLIPPRIGDLLRLRLAQITHKHQQGRDLEYLLVCCAVLGPSFPIPLIEKLLQQEAEAGYERARLALENLSGLLKIVADEDILTHPTPHQDISEDTVVFSQRLMHQILEERAQRIPDANELQRRAAQVKHRYFASVGQLRQHALEIGTHYEQAEEPMEAVRFFLSASQNALYNGNLAEVSSLLERCRSLTANIRSMGETHLRLLLALGLVKLSLGAHADVEALLVLSHRQATLLGDKNALRECSLIEGLHLSQSGNLQAADQHLKKITQSWYHDALDPSTCTPLPDPNADILQLALQLEPIPPSVALGTLMLERARVTRLLQQDRKSDGLVKDAFHLFRRRTCHWGMGQSLMASANALIERGSIQAGQAAHARAIRHLAKLHNPVPLRRAKLSVELQKLTRGSTEVDEQALITLHEQLSVSGSPIDRVRCDLALGLRAHRTSNTRKAETHFSAALQEARDKNLRLLLQESLIAYSRYLARNGECAEALKCLQEALKQTRTHALRSYVLPLQLAFGEMEMLSGRFGQALEWFGKARELAERLQRPLELLQAHALTAQLSHHHNSPLHHNAAMKHLEAALDGAELLEAHLEEVYSAAEALASSCRESQPDTADELLERALEGWISLGNKHRVNHLQAMRA